MDECTLIIESNQEVKKSFVSMSDSMHKWIMEMHKTHLEITSQVIR